jgi:hypothetical protein
MRGNSFLTCSNAASLIWPRSPAGLSAGQGSQPGRALSRAGRTAGQWFQTRHTGIIRRNGGQGSGGPLRSLPFFCSSTTDCLACCWLGPLRQLRQALTPYRRSAMSQPSAWRRGDMPQHTSFVSRLIRRWRDFPLVGEAVVMLVLAGLAIRMVSFPGILNLAARPVSGPLPSPACRLALGARIGWVVPASARRLPWRAKCFPQGLAAQWMLRRRGIPSTFHYGASVIDAGLEAHVWVSDGDTAIVGGRDAPLMRELVRAPAVDGARPCQGAG